MRIPRFLFALLLALNAAAPLHADLIGFWNFNNSGNVGADASGTGNGLTANGAAAYTASGKSGGGLSLNGTNSFLSKATAVAGLPTGNSPYTISAWFKPTAAGDRGIVGWGNYGSNRQVCALRLIGANGIRHYWWGADLDAAPPTPNYSNGQWHHVVAVYNGTLRAIWFDGTKVAEDTPGVNGSTSANFAIGKTVGNEYFQGTLDEVGIWNHALTNAEIANLAAGASPLGPVITSFTSNKATAYEGETVQLTRNVDVSGVTGTYSYTILRGATLVANGTSATGTNNTAIPDLAGTAQDVVYTLNAIETGGNNVTRTAQVTVAADPGKPIANAQSGLSVQPLTAQPITLTGSDPNGGTLTYAIVAPPARGILGGTPPNVTYTANADLYGPDSFTFKVNDGKYDSAPATISVYTNAPPSSISLSATQIPNTKTSDTWIADISSPDLNPGQAHTFALVGGTGSTDNARFSISSHQLRAAQSFVGLTGNTYSIRLRSTDSQGLSVEQAFTLMVVAPAAKVVINEFHYNGINNTIRNEFIELFNNTGAIANLTGWRLSGAVDYSFPIRPSLWAATCSLRRIPRPFSRVSAGRLSDHGMAT